MTRDSKLWWLVMLAAVVAAVSSRLDLIDPLLPAAHTATVHAVIELAALIIGIVGGFLKASPLPISPAGREKYQDDPSWPTR